MASPLEEFLDLLEGTPSASTFRPLFDAAAIGQLARATKQRAIVVHGPPGSGRARVTAIVTTSLRGAGRAVVVDETRKYSPQGESARRAIAAHLQSTVSAVIVLVYTRAVNSDDVLNLHTVDLVSECGMRAHYGLSRRAFIRTYRGSLTDVRHVHEYHLPLPVRDAAHNNGRCSMHTIDPTCSSVLERIFQHETRRRPPALNYPDAFSDADVFLSHATAEGAQAPGLVVFLVRTMVSARSRGPRQDHARGDGEGDCDG
jgi:hypothetical protein